jgi:hypothetical protein
MKVFGVALLAVLTATLHSQPAEPAAASKAATVMVVGVTHDYSVMGGGISSGRTMAHGEVGVEPIAWLTASGKWLEIRCKDGRPEECKRFDREYLSKPHSYSVVSADGMGATVHVERMSLDDECFGFGGPGTFTGGVVRYATVAADTPDMFTNGNPARRLVGEGAERVRKALAIAVGDKLDSTEELRVYSVSLEGQALLVVQRAYQDYASKPEFGPDRHRNLDFIFAIGKMDKGRFQLLSWKENTGDENEQILGVIHLKSGREFLVNTISDPEGYHFRIYGINDSKLALVFEGGGGGC